jgi:transcriptional regulator
MTKPLTEKQVERVLNLFEKGKTNEEVQKQTRFTRQQVAAVRAHVTMGTYGVSIPNPK